MDRSCRVFGQRESKASKALSKILAPHREIPGPSPPQNNLDLQSGCHFVASCVGSQCFAGHHQQCVQNISPQAPLLERSHLVGLMYPEAMPSYWKCRGASRMRLCEELGVQKLWCKLNEKEQSPSVCAQALARSDGVGKSSKHLDGANAGRTLLNFIVLQFHKANCGLDNIEFFKG